MKKAVGVSAFGLKDCVTQPGVSCHERGFYLADVVLPTNPFGRILTGNEAKDARIHTGLYWPLEARILTGEPLRRAPIPYAWRALVEAGDRTVRWNIGHGVSFPLPRIIASHVADLVAEGSSDQILTNDIDKSLGSREKLTVVSIPNNLDEFGQEAFLGELATKGLREAILVWRPVAAALSWLDKVEGDFPSHMGENDHIHVIYLGPDAIEFTTFRLRVKDHNNWLYVLPLRDRPRDLPRLTGMDWAGRIIEESFQGIDHGAFFQAFKNFPEIWELLPHKPWNQKALPRPWSVDRDWTLWNPPHDLNERVYDVLAGQCNTLRNIFRDSCQMESSDELPIEPMEKALRKELHRIARLFNGGRLRGMIVCGPLVPHEIPPWLGAELNMFSDRGLVVDGDLTEPEVGRMWLCADCDDPVAEGAAIYGRRTLAKIPSYLDTMPQVSILAQEQGQYTWVPLLNAQEGLGGQEFKDTIKGKFQLDSGRRKLQVYLHKGALENAPNEMEDPFDAQMLPLEGLTPCQARLVRGVVQKLGSIEAVQRRNFFLRDTNTAQYALAYAEALYKGDYVKDDELSDMPGADLSKTSLRRVMFDFPSPPEQNLVLDIDVRMRPASGLAKIELVPKDTSFLHGQRVRLNYSTMRRTTTLPRRQRGWPRIQELIVDPEDSILYQGENIVGIFENVSPKVDEYIRVINNIRDTVLKRMVPKQIYRFDFYVRAIDNDGQACTWDGNEIIRRIATKFESDFSRLGKARMVERQNRIFTRAAWLYTSTPQNITSYINDILVGNFMQAEWGWATEAASRAFVEEENFRILFLTIANRAKTTIEDAVSFPIHSVRAICRVLMYRKNGEKMLDRDMAKLFARRALERLLEEEGQSNFQNLYFQLILLLFYLLRYRRTDSSCFDPNFPETIQEFEKAIESMTVAMKYFKRKRQHRKAMRVQEIIEGFEKYLYYKGTGDVLTVLTDLAGDMA